MSITPQALERSVLERKERDELAAIATAMGVKTSARASKATLIDHILREAGIETATESASARERTSRTGRGRSRSESPPASPNGASDSAEGGGDAPGAGVADEAGAAEAAAVAEPTPTAPPQPSPAQPEPTAGSATAGDDDDARQVPSRPAVAEAPAPVNGEEDAPAPAGAATVPQADEHQRSGQPGQHANVAEPGNRRGRRRRGRDRGDRGDREFGDRGGYEVQYQGEPTAVEGLLDLREEGYGFLRTTGFLAGPRDVYVSLSQVRRFALRKGDLIEGGSRPAGSSEKYPALVRIDSINGVAPDEARSRVKFEDLTPLFPDEKLRLEIPGDSNNMVARIVDLVSPIGKGQRGLIVSPPKAGKTTVLKQIAHSIEANNPEVHLMVLLVDERPEEVTDMRRSVKGEVVASTFDRPSDEHTQVAELALERAKRMVEGGKDVVIVLDGITRLARAYNLGAPQGGRVMSGGIDTGALYPPKKFFGSARNIEEGGSLTILATALVETGSRMDEVIFEEFKGTGNMELRLDRKLAERRIYPALDVNASSTRHEELLFEQKQLQQVWKLRRVLNALEPGAGLELLMDKIRTTKNNDEFLAEIAKAPTPAG
jgi:transcription termination factor Rho